MIGTLDAMDTIERNETAPLRVPVLDKFKERGVLFVMGKVESGTVKRGEGSTVTFTVTDTLATVPVTYTGILPDLFREGQGVVAEGAFGSNGLFVADTVLAKHDETYMPKEVAEGLKEKGVWQPE